MKKRLSCLIALLLALSLLVGCGQSAAPAPAGDAPAKEAAAETAAEPVEEAAEETAEEPAEETVAEPAEETAAETVAEPAEETVAETVEETVSEAAEETVEEAVEEAAEEAVEETVEEAAAEAAEEAIAEAAEEAVAEAVEAAAAEAVEEAAAEAAEESAEEDPFGREAESEHRIEAIERSEDMPTFREMVYERPDLAELEAMIAEAEEAMNGGADYETVEKLLDDIYLFYYHYDTMCTIADIRSCLDLTDEYYADEYLWCAENYTLVDQDMDGLYYACAASPLAEDLEAKYFWEGFCEQYADESESIYNDTTVALMQEESNLVAEYRALSADPVIEYKGEEVAFNELMETLEGMDYVRAYFAYYEQYNERYADIYIRMVAVREKLAEELGYESYEEMQYLYGYERDYTPEQGEQYLKDIKTWIVPVYQEMESSFVPYQVWYSQLDGDTLSEIIRDAMNDFGGEVVEAYEFMLRHELCDLEQNSLKANMSFMTYLCDYEAPFLFVNAERTNEDILTLAHEFGHYCDGYVNYNSYETIDLAEVYSQGMEYLVLSRLGEQIDEDEAENLARIKMIDTVNMYVQQASFAEFEHRVYELGSENLSAEVLNGIARDVAKEYGYYVSYIDQAYSMGWVDIPHYFEQAFYIVSYPVSNDLAMQIYDLERGEPGAGLQRYLDNLERDFSGLMGLVDAGGFESPFAEGRLQAIAATAREILGLKPKQP